MNLNKLKWRKKNRIWKKIFTRTRFPSSLSSPQTDIGVCLNMMHIYLEICTFFCWCINRKEVSLLLLGVLETPSERPNRPYFSPRCFENGQEWSFFPFSSAFRNGKNWCTFEGGGVCQILPLLIIDGKVL